MSNHPKRKHVSRYTEETLNKAIEDVKSGATFNAACRKYKIPRATLHARVTNKHGCRRGTKLALSDKDEADLARWIELMCSLGCWVSRNQISDSVVLSLKIANKANPFLNKKPGKTWFDRFIRTHRLSEKVKANRRGILKGIGVDGTNKWFSNLNDRLGMEKLHSLSRKRTYTIGEVSLPLNSRTNWWRVKEEGPTVIVAANAAGELIAPMIVFDSNDVPNGYSGPLPRGWSVESNEIADMTSENLYDYVKNHLHRWLLKNSVELPVVLFLYQHLASYMTKALCDFCDQHKILLAILPASPHRATTPIEIKFFPVLRREFTRHLKPIIRRTRVGRIGASEFVATLEKALDTTNIEDNLENGFYMCGLYPLSAERYIRACVKLKPEEDIGDIVQSEEQSEETINVDQSSVLKCIESNLDSETIESFKSAIDDTTWTGNVEDTNLFLLWRKITKNIMIEKLRNKETDDDDVEHDISDSSSNENQENTMPLDYMIQPKSSVTGGKHKPLSYRDNNLDNRNLDKNRSIIVVNPDDSINESDSDDGT